MSKPDDLARLIERAQRAYASLEVDGFLRRAPAPMPAVDWEVDVPELMVRMRQRDAERRLRRAFPEPQRLSLPDREDEYDDHLVMRALARNLYWSIRAALLEEGIDGLVASRSALRAARAAVYDHLGFRQREIAGQLGVTDRTVRNDMKVVRAVTESGRLFEFASRGLPSIPVSAFEPPVG